MQVKPKMATEFPASITMPDTVETRLGTLTFFDGFPDDATVDKVFDNLDFQRAVQAYLQGLPAVALLGMRTGLRQWGPVNQTVDYPNSAWRMLYHGRGDRAGLVRQPLDGSPAATRSGGLRRNR